MFDITLIYINNNSIIIYYFKVVQIAILTHNLLFKVHYYKTCVGWVLYNCTHRQPCIRMGENGRSPGMWTLQTWFDEV
jgi:hypothetical protein